ALRNIAGDAEHRALWTSSADRDVEWHGAGIHRPLAALEAYDAKFQSTWGAADSRAVHRKIAAPVIRMHQKNHRLSNNLGHIVGADHVKPGAVHLQQHAVGRDHLHAGRLRIDDRLQPVFAAIG